MFLLPEKVESLMATLAHLYELKGRTTLQKILVNAKFQILPGQEHDNWDGGIDGHLIILTIPEIIFFDIFDKLDELSKEICTGLNKVNTTIQNEYISNVLIEKEDVIKSDWRADSGLLLEETHIVPASVQKRIWQDGMFRLFISHKNEDKIKVTDLQKRLAFWGIDCFVAHRDIQPTQRWADEIESALFSMDACIAIMTKDYHNSDWTDHEVGCAYGRHVPIIAVRMGKDPYGLIGRFQGLTSNWNDLPIDIMKILLQYPQVKDAFINSVSKCANYDCGNTIAELFPYIDTFTTEQLNKLIDAWQTNDQVRDSFGFIGGYSYKYGPGIKHFIMKWAPDRFPDEKSIIDYLESHKK